MACMKCGRKASNVRDWKEIGLEPCKGAGARRAPWREGVFNGHSFKLIEGTMQCQWCYRQADTKKYWQEIKKENANTPQHRKGAYLQERGNPRTTA